ncbi:MAG TPA: DUF4041 domain-containing protein [Sphingomicrobium sp.]|nr:DUF4041 domain-containing protein [Sphingomicrobium sp.]
MAFVVLWLLLPLPLAVAVWIVSRRLKRSRNELRNTQEEAERAQEQLREEFERAKERFSGIIDADQEEARVRADTAKAIGELEELRASYAEKKAIYDRLLHEIAIFDERLSFAEMGVYEPHFEFSDSEEYKEQILLVREQQKAMVSAKTAVYCTTQWHVDGSLSKGQTMTNRNIRLTLRAFNNECDAAIANTRWNNVNAMEKRILRAHQQIDNMNASNTTYISTDYLRLKLEELYLTHEYREKLKAEREERAEAARLAREEQKLLRDLERAEEEEAYYAKLLEKAKSEARAIVGPQLKAFEQQITMLEKDLAAAHAKAERAKAMAERTRSGYVYIISNIGSFGDGVVKIGLTRRLDPVDRVRELGDASVPFTFDTHAMIYSDDAPALERALHNEFESTRINVQNMRKEFFRASLEEVEAAVKRLAPEAQFFRDIEAQEYRETLARRQSNLEREVLLESLEFPAEI